MAAGRSLFWVGFTCVLGQVQILTQVERPETTWVDTRVRVVSDSFRGLIDAWRFFPQQEGLQPALNEAELFQAIHFASYPRRITDVQIVVYANKEHKNLELLRQHAPFPVKILRQAESPMPVG
ncbi:unnamed protein product [Durusdinium trenchii]|uniref:Uncharacterized protein n=1 Tax=Durusdinium trenchii TaxID=1381693 RepID=A0ABP0PG76_9DINO